MAEDNEGGLPELPKDLLTAIINYFITKHLTTQTDALRFRAVSKTWRSFLSPPEPPLTSPHKLTHPIKPPQQGHFNLSVSTLYLICPPTVCQNASMNNNTWLTRFERTGSGRIRVQDPFSGLKPKTHIPDFPRVLDSLDFGVIEVCKAYSLKFVDTSSRVRVRSEIDHTLVAEKAVVIAGRVMVLYNQGELGFTKLFGDRRWRVSEVRDDQTCYDDLVVFKAMFCVVNRTGRTLLMDLDANSTVEIAGPICGLEGNQKHLVEVSGELYMVDRDLDAYSTTLSKDETTGGLVASELPTTMEVRFRIYKLDEKESQWVEVNSLGDLVLFVGYDCSFGFSARFLPGVKGNCLYFCDECYTYNSCFDDGEAVGVLRNLGCPEAGVFDLEDATVKPLSSSPQHVGLFWPPPAWLHPRSSSSLT